MGIIIIDAASNTERCRCHDLMGAPQQHVNLVRTFVLPLLNRNVSADLQDPLPLTKAYAVNRKPPAKSALGTQSLKRGIKGGNGLSSAAVDLFGNTDPYAFGF